MWFFAAHAFELDEQARWVEAREVRAGEATVSVGPGLGWTVRDGEVAVGFAFVGRVEADVRVARAGEALAIAHALDGQRPDEVLARLVATRRWTEPGEVLVALGGEAAGALDGLPALVEDQHALGWLGPDGMWNLLVTAADPQRDRRRAAQFLRGQVDGLAALGLDPTRGLAEDADRRFVLVGTEQRWTGLLEPAVQTSADRALVWIHDPRGSVDARHSDVLLVHGRDPQDEAKVRVLSRSGDPPSGVAVAGGQVNVVVEPGAGLSHHVGVHARLDLVSDGPARFVALDVPIRDDAPLDGLVAVAPDLVVDHVSVDGAPVAFSEGAFGLAPAGGRRITVELPPGGGQRLDVAWTEDWAAARPLMLQEWAVAKLSDTGQCRTVQGCGSELVSRLPEIVDLGPVTTRRPVLPVIPWQEGSWPAEVRVGTVLGPRWVAAVGGATPELRQVGDGRWWVVEATSRSRVSFGALTEEYSPPVGAIPAVRILSHDRFTGGSPSFVRATLAFFAPVLPPWPVEEVVIVQEPKVPALDDFVATIAVHDARAHDGITGVLDVPVKTDGDQYRGEADDQASIERGLVESLVADAWADLPLPQDDEWLRAALPRLYRDVFVHHAWGDEAARRWDAERLAEGDRHLGLLLALRDRVGEPALLEAVDRWTRGAAPSVETLRDALEATSGADLDGFFDLFVVGGVTPRVELDWTEARGNAVEVRLTASPRWGSYDVPVTVHGRRGERISWVRLTDGEATVTVRPGFQVESVELDAHRWLPLER